VEGDALKLVSLTKDSVPVLLDSGALRQGAEVKVKFHGRTYVEKVREIHLDPFPHVTLDGSAGIAGGYEPWTPSLREWAVDLMIPEPGEPGYVDPAFTSPKAPAPSTPRFYGTAYVDWTV
jgi:hypothetical protein